MKRLLCSLVLILCLVAAVALSACSEPKGSYTYTPVPVTARFMTNADGMVITLASGKNAISENTLFYKTTVNVGSLLLPPETDPEREGYVFSGWTTDREGKDAFDFSKPVTGSVNLYAKWERNVEADEVDSYVEPVLTFTEVIDDSVPFALNGVCCQPVQDGAVFLTRAAIDRLKEEAADLRAWLQYTRASSTEIVSAVYQGGIVTVKYKNGGVEQTIHTTVTDVTDARVVSDAKKDDISLFETKAKRYETTGIDPYKVILAGSSSMEFWTDSTLKMANVTTKNVGIGGTASYHWLNCYADRLIIPYNPRAVVLYVGINDIISSYYKKTGKETAENLIKLFEYLHERLPNAIVHFVLINHVPGYYSDFKSDIDAANNGVIAYAKTHDYVNIIDAGTVLEKASGDYAERYFQKDKLHMSQAGYVLWGAEIKKAVIAKDNELYGNR